ncbi:sodium/solute symporter [Reichenbachiella sp. MALMAid0571]|uniref:sodium:solute symporter family transporter n=1 Tax=Reichenbachiella sp. MALMAid0571 TaxID=3143939 RepID=UPI0032DFB259
MNKSLIIKVIFLLLLSGKLSANKGEPINRIEQRNIGSIKDIEGVKGDEGLAGTFAGVVGDYLIVAGGSAFPEGKPWEGGTKYFSDVLMVFERTEDGDLIQTGLSTKLPFGVAEGASVTTDKGLICIGGITATDLSDEVLLISRNDNITIEKLPKLPKAIKGAAAAAIGSQLYVVGGESPEGIVSDFLMLNLDNVNEGWQKLPDFPKTVAYAMTVAQMDGEEVSLHVFGGRSKSSGEKINTFYSSVYRFRISTGKWQEMQNICLNNKKPLPLAASAVAPIGASHVVLVGGDNGFTFNAGERAINAMQAGDPDAQTRRDSLWQNHPGFNNKILIYNTVTDTWFEAGKWQGTPIAVAPAVNWNNSIIVAAGEIRPGVRNPEIVQLSFSVKPDFGWLNYLVLGLYFGGILFLGFFFMKKESNTDDFFKAGGRIPWWAAGISILGTSLSAITFISIPAKSYATDWRMFVYNMPIVLIVPIVIRYYLPFFRRFNFDTAYEYLNIRFNRSVRWLASSLFVFFMVSRIAIVLFLPALALNAVAGFSVYWAIIIMGVVTIIYCTSGGIEAVVWGDVVQCFILLSGAFVALMFMLTGVEGGLGSFIDITVQQQKFHTFDFRFDFSQPVFWVVIIGGLANSLISFTSDQSIVQRYMTTHDEKATARSIWLNGLLSIPVTIIFFLLGTALYAYYTSNPERLSVVNPNIDSVFPQFIVGQMPTGVAGLLIAAIFAAAMSTLSSNINSVAAVVTSDFYKSIAKNSSTSDSMRIARWSGIIVGILGIGMALILATWNIASLWDQFNTFVGLLTGGLGALFIMGIFFPRISGSAALIGTIGSLAILLFVKNHTDLSFLLYGLVGLVTSIALALIASIFKPNQKEITDFTWHSHKKSR